MVSSALYKKIEVKLFLTGCNIELERKKGAMLVADVAGKSLKVIFFLLLRGICKWVWDSSGAFGDKSWPFYGGRGHARQ